MYKKNLIEAVNKIKIKNKRILLQLPEGLWMYGEKITKILEKNSNKVFWYLGKSYGACDIPIEEAKRLKCDIILHIGHSPFLKEKEIEGIKIIYLELFMEYNSNKVIHLLEKYDIKEGVIVGHLPYTREFPKIVKKAKEKNIKLELKKHDFLPHPGQILGCNIINAVTSKKNIIYIGDGVFHLHGLFTLGKDIFAINPLNWEVKKISKKEQQQYQIKKYAAYSAVEQSKKIGIIVSSKIGQFNVFAKSVIEQVKKEFKDKDILLIVANEIKKEELEFLKVDAFVNLACPRLEDDKDFPKPIISWKTYTEIKRKIHDSLDSL